MRAWGLRNQALGSRLGVLCFLGMHATVLGVVRALGAAVPLARLPMLQELRRAFQAQQDMGLGTKSHGCDAKREGSAFSMRMRASWSWL